MADAKSVEIAKAVTAHLAAGEYALTLDVRRSYVPQVDRDRLKRPQVFVMAKAHDELPESRHLLDLRIPIDVGLIGVLDPCDVDQGDLLMLAVDQLVERLSLERMAGASWLKTEQLRDEEQMPYIFAEARRSGTLVAVFRVTYRAEREID